MVLTRPQKRGERARQAIFTCVSERWLTGSYSPTIREIAAETRYSIATVHRHVRVLVAQGRLQGSGRSLRPISPLRGES